MGSYIGITGTPGTGKKSIAPLVAAQLGIPCYGLNELAASFGLLESRAESPEVDAPLLGEHVRRKLRGPCVIYGHLLPYALRRGDMKRSFVLRCEPSVLKARLLARSYDSEKLRGNLEAELIGTVSFDARAVFGPIDTIEIDTTRSTPVTASRRILRLLSRRAQAKAIDWITSYASAAKLRGLLEVGAGSAFT